MKRGKDFRVGTSKRWNSVDSPFLLTGYRPQLSLWQCAASAVCYWHNETINIWSSILLVAINLGLTMHIIRAQ